MVVNRSQRRGNDKRERILKYVIDQWMTGSYAPTVREIAAEVGISVATTHRHLRILVELGSLQGRGRTLRPISPLKQTS